MLWPGLRLYAAFKSQTLEPLAMEGHILEMVAAVTHTSSLQISLAQPKARGKLSASSMPAWFLRTKERLHEQFHSSPRMRDLAADAGVHPVHLARVFRKFERQTPGDYLQRVRIKAACRLLRDPDYPLAYIAADCGFADQSHFTRVFKKFTHNTPAEFRRTVWPQ